MRKPNRRTDKVKEFKSLSAQVHAQDRMRRIRISPHPPSFDYNPWFSLVVRIAPGGIFTVAQLQAALASQIGMAVTTNYSPAIRLIEARFWGPLRTMNASTAMEALTVQFIDPLSIASISGTAQPDTCMIIQDYPNQVSRSCIGFRYSKAQQQHSIGSTLGSSQPLYRIDTSGAGTSGILGYITLLWRPEWPSAPSLQGFDLI